MATALDISTTESSPDLETPLLGNSTGADNVDYKGLPANKSSSGGWRSASFIIGVEMAERFAYYGISSNLINYLSGPLGQSMAVAAENVNTWSGVATLLPLLGAFVADSFLGRYRTIVIASCIYILGLSFLTLSTILPLGSSECQHNNNVESCSPQLQVILFFFSLYLVALGQGGHKPCVQAFGADQFDGEDRVECRAKSSFFNWWYFCISASTLVTLWILNYIQDNLNWGLGFGIPCISMVFALVVFLLGTKTYRFTIKGDEKNPFVRIGNVFIAAAKSWKTAPTKTDGAEAKGTLRFLNKALLVQEKGKTMCSISDVEDAKAVLRLVPIWASLLIYAIVFAQYQTFFTKQGVTMDRSIWSGFEVSPASLQSFVSLAIVIFLPIYDCILVPLTRSITRKPSGITILQRIGIGMLVSIICMIVAALVERKRLNIAIEYGLIDMPKATVPMGIWWLVPQFTLLGIADVFTMVGLQEFFYDQVPNELRSVGLSLYLSIFGVGSFLSSFLVSAIDKVTSLEGQDSWFSDNLNRAHLDYFYWLLAGISAVALVAYMCASKAYIYNK